MGKITFFEEKNFGGRHFECSSDNCDMLSHFNRCNSIKVESGCFMIYELPNHSGQQYFLRKGEYPDYHSWMGTSDSICSCLLICMDKGSFNMRLYERLEFGGQMMDLTEDCPSIRERFHTDNIFSCTVKGGNWLFYENPHYSGRMYLIKPGDYKRFSEWGGRCAKVGSVQRLMDY